MKPILATLVAVALGLSVTSINANNTKERRPVLQTSDGTTVLQKQQKERVDKKTKSEAAGSRTKKTRGTGALKSQAPCYQNPNDKGPCNYITY